MEFILGAAATATGVVAGATIGAICEIRKANKKLNSILEPQLVLRYAHVPKILKHAEGWKEEEKGQIGLTVGKADEQFATAQSILFIQDFLSKRHSPSKIVVPKNALAVSFVTANFRVGKSAQEFIPKNYEMPTDAFFTYQMLSTQAQATYYNEDGEAYLAGICYYLTPKGQRDYFMESDDRKIRLNLLRGEPFPKQDRMKTYSYTHFKIYSRQCKKAGKRVVVQVNDNGEPEHYGFDFMTQKKTFQHCEECVKDYKEYKFETEEVPVEVAVEEPEEPKEEPKIEEKKEKDESVKVEETVEKDPEDKDDFDFCDEMEILCVE